MKWKLVSTETFSKEFNKYKKDNSFVQALDKKLEKLKEDPYVVGSRLSGNLHSYFSTRIIRKFRLIFKIVDKENEIHLSAIDHWKFDYRGFNL